MFEGNLSFHLATETQEEYAARILPRTKQLIPPEGVVADGGGKQEVAKILRLEMSSERRIGRRDHGGGIVRP